MSSLFSCLLRQDAQEFFKNPKLRRSIIVIMSDLSQSASYTDEEAFCTGLGFNELRVAEGLPFAFNESNREVLIAEYRGFESQKIEAFAGKLIGHMLKQICALRSRSAMLRVLSSFIRWRDCGRRLEGLKGTNRCAVEVLRSVFGMLNCVALGVLREMARKAVRRWGGFAKFAEKEREFHQIQQRNRAFYDSSVSEYYEKMTALQKERTDIEGKLAIQNCRNTRSLQDMRKLKQELGLTAPELKLKELQDHNLELSGRIEALQDIIAEYIKKTSGVFEQKQKRSSFSHKRNNTHKVKV